VDGETFRLFNARVIKLALQQEGRKSPSGREPLPDRGRGLR